MLYRLRRRCLRFSTHSEHVLVTHARLSTTRFMPVSYVVTLTKNVSHAPLTLQRPHIHIYRAYSAGGIFHTRLSSEGVFITVIV